MVQIIKIPVVYEDIFYTDAKIFCHKTLQDAFNALKKELIQQKIKRITIYDNNIHISIKLGIYYEWFDYIIIDECKLYKFTKDDVEFFRKINPKTGGFIDGKPL